MTDPAYRLRKARSDAGYSSAKEAAEAMGIPISGYIQHENGTRGYPKDKAERYAKFFRTTPEWLLYGRRAKGDVSATDLGPQVPLVGSIAAGVWKESLEYIDLPHRTFTGRRDIKVPMKDRFGLLVEGDSMDLLFPAGTILECTTFWHDKPIENGQPVIVQRRKFDGTLETTVKEYFKDADGVEWLVPKSRNPAFQAPFRCDQPGSDVETIEIIAIVVADTRLWGPK